MALVTILITFATCANACEWSVVARDGSAIIGKGQQTMLQVDRSVVIRFPLTRLSQVRFSCKVTLSKMSEMAYSEEKLQHVEILCTDAKRFSQYETTGSLSIKGDGTKESKYAHLFLYSVIAPEFDKKNTPLKHHIWAGCK